MAFVFLTSFLPLKLVADNIMVDGRQREYKTYIPEGLGENRPLMISMHGMNQDADYQRGMLQIESIADTAKFATVFPEGINRSWDITGQSDINFVLAIIDDMAQKYNIDKNRVYLSGFSMGGMFTYHAMNYIADRIAAFAPISGYPMGGQPFESLRPVPIIHTHGTTDDVVTYENVQARLDGWIARNGCSPTPMVTEEYRYNGCTRYQWGPGDEGAEVVLIERANKGHWIANDVFYSAEEIWNFCKRYSLNVKSPSIDFPSLPNDKVYNVMGKGEKLGSLLIQAEVKSEENDIVSVAFYGDGELLAEISEAPFEYEWTDVAHGQHFIKGIATDSKGLSIARMKPIKVSNRRKSYSISSDFKEGIVPAGWITYDSRVRRVGPLYDLSKGSRVMEFTGDPHAFSTAFYVLNITGAENQGWISFGDNESAAALYLPIGPYSFSFDACNWDMPDYGEVRCFIQNAYTDEIIAESSLIPEVNIGGSTDNPFANVNNCEMRFEIKDVPIFIKIQYYAENTKKADALIGNIKIQKDATESQEDIEVPSQIVKVEYFDLLGRKTLPSQSKVLIQRTYFSNGTIEVKKSIGNEK